MNRVKKLVKWLSFTILTSIFSSFIKNLVSAELKNKSVLQMINIVITSIPKLFISLMKMTIPVWIILLNTAVVMFFIIFFKARSRKKKSHNRRGFEWLKRIPPKGLYGKYAILYWFVCNKSLTAKTLHHETFSDLETIPLSKVLLDRQVLLYGNFSINISHTSYEYLRQLFYKAPEKKKKVIKTICENDFFELLILLNNTNINEIKIPKKA